MVNLYTGIYDLTGHQRDSLYVIVGLDDPHGLALKASLENYYEKVIHYGQLYLTLDTLVEEGLVDKAENIIENIYSLISRGRHEIESPRG